MRTLCGVLCSTFCGARRGFPSLGEGLSALVTAATAGLAGATDGTNRAARFNSPQGIAADAAGNLYISDSINNVIRKLVLVGTNWIVCAGVDRITVTCSPPKKKSLFLMSDPPTVPPN